MVKSDDHGAGTNESETVRRKFSMPKRVADRIRVLAIEHYGKNQSQLVRSAVADHAYTLEGGDRTLLQEATDGINYLCETVDELQDDLDMIDPGSEQRSATEIAGAPSENTAEDSLNGHNVIQGDMWPVYRQLADAYPAVLTVDRLVSSSDLSEVDVRHALVDLQNRGKIASGGGERLIEYEITTGDLV